MSHVVFKTIDKYAADTAVTIANGVWVLAFTLTTFNVIFWLIYWIFKCSR
jgi:hypothetical protein